jgi:hypothetical protein
MWRRDLDAAPLRRAASTEFTACLAFEGLGERVMVTAGSVSPRGAECIFDPTG